MLNDLIKRYKYILLDYKLDIKIVNIHLIYISSNNNPTLLIIFSYSCKYCSRQYFILIGYSRIIKFYLFK